MHRTASKISYNDIVALDKTLNDLRLKRHSVLNDGNCFYRAISHQMSLFGHHLPSENIRKKSVSYLRQNTRIGGFPWASAIDNGETKESYLLRHSLDGVLADDIMIQAAASSLGYAITIVTALEILVVAPYTTQVGKIIIGQVDRTSFISLEGEGPESFDDLSRIFSLRDHLSTEGIVEQTDSEDASAVHSFSPIHESADGKRKLLFILLRL